MLQSRDAGRHLDWILEPLKGRHDAIAELKRAGHLVDGCVRWDSVGYGGPTLSPQQMRILAALNVERWFDVYFAGEDGKEAEEGEAQR